MPTFGAMADKFIAAHEGGWKNRKHARNGRRPCASTPRRCATCRSIRSPPQHVLACLSPIWNERPETGVAGEGPHRGDFGVSRSRRSHPRGPAKSGAMAQLARPHAGQPEEGRQAARPLQGAALQARCPPSWRSSPEIDTAASRALQLTILCATRTNETIGARWDEISLDDKVWSIPAVEDEDEARRTTSRSAIRLSPSCALQHEARDERNPHVFPGRPMRSL